MQEVYIKINKLYVLPQVWFIGLINDRRERDEWRTMVAGQLSVYIILTGQPGVVV